MIAPAPRKPMPVTIWAAMRVGSTVVVSPGPPPKPRPARARRRHEDAQEKIALERQVAGRHAVTLPRAGRRGHAPAAGILSHSATMDRRPPMDSEALREHLRALLDAQDAHMTFEEAVADFPDDAINMRPPNVPYTPWHLLEHLRIAQWDILEYIRDPGHVSPDWPGGGRARAQA